MEPEQEEKSNFERLFEQTTTHLETRAAYATLVAVEKGSEIISSITRWVIVGLIGFIILFFFSMGFAYWLGEKLGSQAKGFALAGLIFIPFAIAAYLWVKPLVSAKIIQTFLDDDNTQSKNASAQSDGVAAPQDGTQSAN